MNFEQVKIIDEIEESECFEDLPYTRDFGSVPQENVKNILKENSEYWRLPTIAEFSALYKQKKLKSFKSNYYWAYSANDRDLAEGLMVFKIGLFGSSGLFTIEVPKKEKNLVLFKKGTKIEGTEEETKKIIESYPFR